MILVSVYLILLSHLIVVSFSSICVFISLCVASVSLALVFMPGLHSNAYIGLPFVRFMRLPLVWFYCLCDFGCVFCFYFYLSRRCPLLATLVRSLLSAFALLISERISGLLWFGSVHLVTTAGFRADQLIM